MTASVRKIEHELGFKNGTLNYSTIFKIYQSCAFETAWSRFKVSPWCTILDLEKIKPNEYAEDLKYYWVDSYGYPLTYTQACTAFADLYKFLASAETYPKATFYFTHSGTVLKMLAHLGLHKDDAVLRNVNYADMP